MKVINCLLGYKDMYIMQDNEMFNFSLDSVLLPNFITINKKINNVLDIGCGNAPIPLILSTKTSANIIGVEIQKEVYDLAIESVSYNKLNDRIKIYNEDINEFWKNLPLGGFDIITCNPPFFKYKDDSKINKNDYKTIARHEKQLNLEQICDISKKLLKNNGVLGIVHRPERLIDIILEMKKNNIDPKKVQLVYPHKDSNATILLIEGRKTGNPGLKILPPLYSHKSNGDYTDEIKKFFENN